MRKIAATYVFTGTQPPIKNGIITLDDNGTVLKISQPENLTEQQNLEFYSGILVPGFVNAHCHLELSHLKGKIWEKTGIGDFVGQINLLRNQGNSDVEKAMQTADRLMWAAGIAATGDISNSQLSIDTKKKSPVFYHTFIESFGFHPSRAERAFELAAFLENEFSENGLACSVVPHSPYSVSQPLFEKIKKHVSEKKSIVSIHNQESQSETEFFATGTGGIASHIAGNLGIDISHWKPTGKSSLVSVLEYLPKENTLLLVHNTFTDEKDLEILFENRRQGNTFFVLCPGSNLYIENALPPVSLFRKHNLNICLGTDSLASNHQLSVLEEMKILQQNFAEISLEELVKWGCLNGAKALGIENTFGSFETGKTPGVNLVTGIDFRNLKLTEKSKIKRLV